MDIEIVKKFNHGTNNSTTNNSSRDKTFNGNTSFRRR